MLEYIDAFDKSLIYAINQWHQPLVDFVMYWASETITWIPFYAFLIFVLYRTLGWKATLFWLMVIALLITVADQFTSSFMKPYFSRLRPSHALEGLALPAGKGGTFGFASSHAANTFALAMMMFLLLRFRIKSIVVLFIWAAFVSFSRVYLGLHYLTDVLVGAGVGMLAAWLLWLGGDFITRKYKIS